MKRIVLVLLSFYLMQISYSQTPTPLQINGDNLKKYPIGLGGFDQEGINLIGWRNGGIIVGDNNDIGVKFMGWGSTIDLNDAGDIDYSASRNHLFSNGYVGIGTTTPTAKLDVNGDISLTGNLKIGYGKSLIFDQLNLNLIGYSESTLKIGAEGQDYNLSINGFGHSIYFGDGYTSYNAAGYAEHNATYHNFATGSVGIGTIPNFKLDVDGDINISSGHSFKIGGVPLSGVSQWLTNGNCIYYNSGNVRIGNTSIPEAKLTVDGLTYINGSTAIAGNAQIEGGGYWYGNIQLGEENGHILSVAATTRFCSNVGIGTDSPNNKLEINHGTTGNSGLRFTQLNSLSTTTSGNGKYLSVNSTGDVVLVDGNNSNSTWNLTGNSGTNPSSQFIGTVDNQDFVIKTNNIEKFRVKSNGNVGIGNSTPGLLLTIGGGQQPTSGIRLYDNYDGTEFWDFIAEQQQGGFSIRYGATSHFFINSNGNVGIGTTNPTAKLAVNGTIMAKEINITLTGWSDFVFHPTYKLRTLGEVEQFIKTNNHLPEIPTESEVKQNGIGLGEMNAKLLQKIEELTLYMIEQQKQTSEQQKQMLEQQKQINELKELNNMLVKEIQNIKK